MVRLPRPEQDLKTQTTYSTPLKHGSEDSQYSGAYALQVWWRPVSCEAKIRGRGEVLCAKSTFFLVWAVNRHGPSLPTALLTGFSMMEGKSCFVFCFLER